MRIRAISSEKILNEKKFNFNLCLKFRVISNYTRFANIPKLFYAFSHRNKVDENGFHSIKSEEIFITREKCAPMWLEERDSTEKKEEFYTAQKSTRAIRKKEKHHK